MPPHHRVDREPECAELIFRPLTIAAAEVPPLPMKDCPRHTAAALASVEPSQNAPVIVFAIKVGPQVKGGRRPRATIARARADGFLLLRIDRMSSEALTSPG